MKPRIFIGSSVEGLGIAYAIQQNLLHDAETTVWDQGVFELSSTTIESLTNTLGNTDFAIFVFSSDDVIKVRGTTSASVRDNVLFEFGLFIGKIGRDRVFFVIPNDGDLHIPSDLLGITPGKYDAKRTDGSLQAATGPVCHQIRSQVKKLGLFNVEKIKPDEPSDAIQENDAGGWFMDFAKKNYESAQKKLKEKISDSDETEKLRLLPWLPYTAFKMDPQLGTQGLKDFAQAHSGEVNTQQLVARFFLWEGLVDEALKFIENIDPAIKMEPEILAVLADCYVEIGETEKAAESLSSGNTNNKDIALKLSEIYSSSKDHALAFNVIRTALLKSPKDETLLYKCARQAMEIEQNKIAIYLLDELTKRFPESQEYWGYFGNCCLTLDLYDHALAAYRRADNLAAGKAEWISGNIGNLFSNKGLPTEAAIYLKKAIALDENSQYAHDRLASALRAKQEQQKRLEAVHNEGRSLLRAWALPTKNDTQPLNSLLSIISGGGTT